jgi:non-homologous end joining protein Ku
MIKRLLTVALLGAGIAAAPLAALAETVVVHPRHHVVVVHPHHHVVVVHHHHHVVVVRHHHEGVVEKK